VYVCTCVSRRAPQSFTLSESLIDGKKIANGWQIIDLANADGIF